MARTNGHGETILNHSTFKRRKMVTKGQISKPFPVAFLGPEYDGIPGPEYVNIPVDPGPPKKKTFERPSSSHGWLHSLWTNIISAKWAGNLMTATSDLPAPIKISKPLSCYLEPFIVSRPNTPLSNPRRPGKSGSGRLTLIS